MCVSTDQDIAIQLSLYRSERLHITPRDNLMPMDDANLKVMDLDHFGLWQARNLVAVASHDMGLTFCGSQILKPFNGLKKEGQKVCVNNRKRKNIMLLTNDIYVGRKRTSFEPTLPGQITCCILPGMSKSLNWSGSEAER